MPRQIARAAYADMYGPTVGKSGMIHNAALPQIEVDRETCEVRADGALLTCEPAAVRPLAQRYFLY